LFFLILSNTLATHHATARKVQPARRTRRPTSFTSEGSLDDAGVGLGLVDDAGVGLGLVAGSDDIGMDGVLAIG
jgi:hypothetical protein